MGNLVITNSNSCHSNVKNIIFNVDDVYVNTIIGGKPPIDSFPGGLRG